LRRLLHVWSMTAVAARQPGYYEELTAARAGTATTVPVTEAIPDWAERAAPPPARHRRDGGDDGSWTASGRART
jgi:hypothetical protein